MKIRRLLTYLIVTLLTLSCSASVLAMEPSKNLDLEQNYRTDEQMFDEALDLYNARISNNEDTKLQRATLTDSAGYEYFVEMFPVYEEEELLKTNNLEGVVSKKQAYAICLEDKYIEDVNTNSDMALINESGIMTSSLSQPRQGWDENTYGVKLVVTIYWDQIGNNGYKLTGVHNSWTSYQTNTVAYEISTHYKCCGSVSSTDDRHWVNQDGWIGTPFNNQLLNLTNKVTSYAYDITEANNQVGAVTFAKLAHNNSYWEMYVPNWIVNEVPQL